MVSSTSMVLALAFAAGAHASISTKIAGYYPGSNVEDHNAVDISGKALSRFLAGKDYDGVDSNNAAKGASLGAGAASIKYYLAKSMYKDGVGGSSQYVTYTVDTVSADLSPAMITTQTADEVSSVWGFANQVTGSRDTTGVVEGQTRSNTYVCQEDTDADGDTTPDLPLGKMALKSNFIGAHGTGTATGQALKVYMSNTVWAGTNKECGKVPFRTAVSSTCPGTAATTTSDACANQYKHASCPGGGEAATSTTVKIKCVASAAWAKDITYIANGATTYGQRTLKGFSTAVQAKMITGPTLAEPEAVAVKAFHKVPSYGDMTISAALEALTTTDTTGSFSSCTVAGVATPNAEVDAVSCTGDWVQGTAICKHTYTHAPMVNLAGTTYADEKAACSTAGGKVTDFFMYTADGSDAADKKKLTIEVIQKMAVYTNAWLYTIHEFEDAIADCKAATIHDNDEGVHAWDEGVAFYTGSNAGEAGYPSNGNMIYALANKRCKNFKTCGVGEFSGNSAVNIALFGQFAGGMNACQVGNCVKAQGHLDKIIPLMSVPLIQGTLRYAYKVAVLQDAYKGFGEGYAFMMSVIHRVNVCSVEDAKIIYEALDIPDVDPGVTGFKLYGTATAVDAAAPGKGIAAFTVVKEAFERNYDCMGITCADVGSLHDDNQLAMEGAEACGGGTGTGTGTGTNTVTEKDVLPTWAIIAIAGAGALVVLFFGMMCAYKSSKDMTIKMYNDLKKEGAVGKV
jgi:hypothetical protein